MPTAAPQNVAVQAATATQLDVTWEPPPPEAQNGDIQGYKVHEVGGNLADLHGGGSQPGTRLLSMPGSCPSHVADHRLPGWCMGLLVHGVAGAWGS